MNPSQPRTTSGLTGQRVIVVLQSPYLGGAERQALLLARELRDAEGSDVHIWGFAGCGAVSEHCASIGVPWRQVEGPRTNGKPSWPLSFLHFARELRAAKPDVLLPYVSYANVSCGMVWRLTGARVCVWNQRDEGHDITSARMARIAVRLTPMLIANSRRGCEFLRTRLGADPRRVHLVHNGVAPFTRAGDPDRWRSGVGCRPDSLLACMVANLTPKKDHATLVRAWGIVARTLASQRRSAALFLAGAFGGAEGEVRRLARQLDIEDQVVLLGPIADVPALLNAMDFAAFSSTSEGCPNGVLECMAAGLAVAGTDIPGIRDVVSEANHSLLAAPGDAEGLAEHILALAADPRRRSEVGERNRARILADFSVERLRESTVALIGQA